MTLKLRFSLIALGIVLFLIATPIMVLYARGFKYDFSTRKITKTGTLVVKTQPTKASVYLDGKLQKSDTPSNIRFVLPKDYDVRIEKEGYQPWNKRLTVNSQLVTWVNNYREFITLFLSKPVAKESFPATNVLVSKNRDEIVFTENDQYKLLNIKNGNISNLGSASQITLPALPALQIQWENASKNVEILISKNRGIIPDEQLKTLKYMESDGNHVIFLFNQDLYSSDLVNLSLIDKNVTSATLAADGIWYAQNNSLKRFDYNQNSSEIILATLPPASQTTILRAAAKIFLTLDSTLYVLNDKLEPIYSPVTFTNWDSASNQLLFGNQNEIQVYNPVTKNSSLIVRTTTQVIEPKHQAQTGYVFFGNQGQIKAVELDGRDHRNIYTIIENAGTNPKFEISPDGRELYLFNEAGGQIFTIR